MTNIYFITDGEFIKIGKSKNPKRRKKQLQTGNGNNLRVAYILENVEDYLERDIHSLCRRYKKQGEWFEKDVMTFLFSLPWYKDAIKST